MIISVSNLLSSISTTWISTISKPCSYLYLNLYQIIVNLPFHMLMLLLGSVGTIGASTAPFLSTVPFNLFDIFGWEETWNCHLLSHGRRCHSCCGPDIGPRGKKFLLTSTGITDFHIAHLLLCYQRYDTPLAPQTHTQSHCPHGNQYQLPV